MLLLSSEGNPLHSTALEEDLSPRAEQNQRAAPEKTGRQRAAGRTPTTNKPKSVPKAVEKITASKENQEPSEPRKQGAAAPVRYNDMGSHRCQKSVGCVVQYYCLCLLLFTVFYLFLECMYICVVCLSPHTVRGSLRWRLVSLVLML